MDKYLIQYITDYVKIVEPEKNLKIPLKQVFNDYKSFLSAVQVQPLSYRSFRSELIEVLKTLEPSIEVFRVRGRWVVSNIRLVDSGSLRRMYKVFSHI